MGTGKKEARCEIDFTPTALDDLADIDQAARQRIFDRLEWLALHHDKIKHEGLRYLPRELSGIKKRREGDYRILYWYYPGKRLIRVYGVSHRSIVYRKLKKR